MRSLRHPSDSTLDRLARLTPRELEVLHFAAVGFTAPETASWLGVSPSTVRAHRNAILVKVGMHSITAVVASAVRYGFVNPGAVDHERGGTNRP